MTDAERKLAEAELAFWEAIVAGISEGTPIRKDAAERVTNLKERLK